MKTKSLFFLLPLFLLLSGAAAGQWERVDSKHFPIVPPPQAGTDAYKSDFSVLHEYQRSRSREDCALALQQEHPDFSSFFGENFSLLTEEEKALARPLAEKMMKLSMRVSGYHKGKFQRPRPYRSDLSLKPCAKMPSGSRSYPSSHAASSAAGACVLSLFFPEKKAEIEAAGDYFGELRVIGGVHHPSDVKAGLDLGKRICSWAQGQPDFQRKLGGLR